MTITPHNTLGQLQIHAAKMGVDSMTWLVVNSKHIVTLYGPGYDGTPLTELGQGYGKTYVEALDDAFTALTQAIGDELAKED